eukprot:6188530-Pleurochrysis_carterae.AAC.2
MALRLRTGAGTQVATYQGIPLTSSPAWDARCCPLRDLLVAAAATPFAALQAKHATRSRRR